MSRSILAHLSFNFYRYYQADYRHAQFRSSARLFMARISPDHRSEFRPKIGAKEMSCSFLAHLSFNFCRSCQAGYRHAQYRSSARLFMARISPLSSPEFSYGKDCLKPNWARISNHLRRKHFCHKKPSLIPPPVDSLIPQMLCFPPCPTSINLMSFRVNFRSGSAVVAKLFGGNLELKLMSPRKLLS